MNGRFLLPFIAAIALATPVAAKREPPLTDEDRTIVQIFPAEGLTKDQIYSRSRVWIAENFKSSKAVIEYENRDEGTIIGNGSIKFPCESAFSCMTKADWRVPFTIKVEAKDGKLRVSFTNIHMAWPASYNSGIATPAADFPVHQRKELERIRPALLNLAVSLSTTVGKSSEW